MTPRRSLTFRVLSRGTICVAFAFGLYVGYRGIVLTPAPLQAVTVSAILSVPPGQAVAGSIDTVAGQSVISATPGSEIHLSGWAACNNPESPLMRVDVLVDNERQTMADAFSARPEVALAYGRADFEKSGWQSSFSTSEITEGTHDLTARAICGDGQSGVLPQFQLVLKSR